MDGQTKVPYSQLLIDLSKNQISVTEASEYVDHLRELKRSLDTQYLLVDKDATHVNDKLQIANQRQQLSIIGHQKLVFLKALLKDKKQDLKEKLASEVEKTHQWKKETQFIVSKHEVVFNERKVKYEMHPLAQQRRGAENEYNQIEIMVNIQAKALEDAKMNFYKFNAILEQISRLHTVQIAEAYLSFHQAMKRKLDLAAKLRHQKQEVENLKLQKENIFKDGLKIKTHTTSQADRSTSYKQTYDGSSKSVTPKLSPGITGSRDISPRITLDNIPRLHLPEWQGTPPKMPCLSSVTGASYKYSNPLTKMLKSTFSLFKSNTLRSATNTSNNTLKGFGEKEQRPLQDLSTSVKLSSATMEKQNEKSASENVELLQSSTMDTEPNSSAKPAENAVHDKNGAPELQVQDFNMSGDERMNNCNAQHSVLNRSSESEHDSVVNMQENMAERDNDSTESHDKLIPLRKWKKSSPEYHHKPFPISSLSKLNAKPSNEKSSYFEQNTMAKSNLQANSINFQEKEQVNRELTENTTEHEVPKESGEASAGVIALSKDKALHNSDDCIPCTPVISPTGHSNSSGAALTGYDLSPNSYTGTDGFHSPNMDRWSPTNTLPEAADGSSQGQAAEAMNIFDGPSIPSSQGFSLAFDFGSSTITSSATTMLFGENEGDKQTSKDSKKKDDGSNFSFGFQPIFKMF